MNRDHPPLLERVHTEIEFLLSDMRQEAEFHRPCDWDGCEVDSGWCWRCRVCGVCVYLCTDHDYFLRESPRVKQYECGQCATVVNRWASLYRRVPL